MPILASGVVLYRSQDRTPLFLLLKNASHGTWGFPKGHWNPGEDLKQAALRECLEETGIQEVNLDLSFHKEILHTLRDPARGPMEKRTHYFLARVVSEQVRLSREHSRFSWEGRESARRTLRYDALRELLDCAYTSAASSLGIPQGDKQRAEDLLFSLSRPDDIWRKHSIEVSRTAKHIGEALLQLHPELPLDLPSLEASALLHDIGRSLDHGAEHPRLGMELLLENGLGHLAKPCLSHWLKGRDRETLSKNPYFTPARLDAFFTRFDLETFTLFEKIVAVADSLVQHDRRVRLDERYREVRLRYGDSPWMRDNESMTEGFIGEIEGLLDGSLYDLLRI